MLIDGLDYCDVFISCLDSYSDGTHSHPLVSKWLNATFLQIWWRNKLIYILDVYSKIQVWSDIYIVSLFPQPWVLWIHPSSSPVRRLRHAVDPNEPTYCLCHQVSYGEMIGCDNPDVRRNAFKQFISISSLYLFNQNAFVNSVPLSGFTSLVLIWQRNPKGNGTSFCSRETSNISVSNIRKQPFFSFFQVLSTMHPGSKEKMRCTFVTLRDYISIWVYIYMYAYICILSKW